MEESPEAGKPQKDLPRVQTVLVLGILSIILVGILSVVLAIIALNISADTMKLYHRDPQLYTAASYSKLKTGKICSVIGLSISGILLLVALAINLIDIATFLK